MKKKLNLSNALENAEFLEEQLLKKELNEKIKFETYLLDKRYYYKDGSYKLIYNTLKYNVGKSWNEIRNQLRAKIKKELHYRIDRCVLHKNRNGSFINSYGQIETFLPTVYTTGRIWQQYYIENDIIKVYKPYKLFPKPKFRRVIKKKEIKPEKTYTFKFDYDIIDDETSDVRKFIKLLELNKKTYRVRRIENVIGNLQYNKQTGRWDRETQKEFVITHIKTHYD